MAGIMIGEVRSDFDVDEYFFFQAEDGIRDYKVTGVQTCALPILKCAIIPLGYHMRQNR